MTAKQVRMSTVNHAAGIFADMSVDGPAIGTLVAVVDRAKNLPNRKTMGKQNPYCAARLGKEAKKTDTDLRGGQTPKWDQELRFTVHESPDYFRLKVSVFNDDKRTDLIGETWVDLRDLIIPGGSQSDHWHPLQFRGKYAGEIRIEMTYYDTRPEDEAVIERRTQGVVEKASTKPSTPVPASPATPVSASNLAGPRQLKDVKRRPLPTDPTGTAAPRPTLPEKAPSAPPAMSHPSRPAQYDNIPTPPSSSGVDYVRHPPRHSAPPEPVYDTQPHGLPSPAMRPARTYETPDDFQREWNAPVPAPAPAPAPAPVSVPVSPPVHHQGAPGPSKRYQQEPHYPSYRERTAEAQDSRSYYPRPHSGYDNAPPADYRSMRQEPPLAGRQDQYYPELAEMHAPPQHEVLRPSSHHHNQPYPAQDQYGHGTGERTPPQTAHYHSRASGSMSGRHLLEYRQEDPRVAPAEPDRHYRPHSNSFTRGRSPVRHSVSRDGYHAEYATMQPRVEDEEEEGPPPPPPVHRSGLVQSSQQLVPSPTPSYKAYSVEYEPSPRTSHEVNMSHPSHQMPDEDRFHDLPLPTDGPAMPPSLVAGFDPVIADAESDRAAYENRARRRSGVHDDDAFIMPSREPSPAPPHYPVSNTALPPAQPQEDYRMSLVTRRSVNAPDNQLVPRRKSVSPQPPRRKSVSPHPPPSRGNEYSQTPFSPDSFDAYNPNAARAAVTRDPAPAYETPAQAMEAARRTEAEEARKPGPIIGDDGREIDPSDHLPTDTWAPEPDRKPRKPGVIVRFKNAPARTNRAAIQAPPAKDYGSTRTTTTTVVATTATEWGGRRPMSSYMSNTDSSPRGDYSRGREGYGGSPGHGRTYSTSTGNTPSPRGLRRNSVSPAPAGSHSPSSIYAPVNVGPPIPAKVPIAAPVAPGQGGVDALSRELNSIDIGSVGCSSGRAMRKYVPPKTVTGYAR